MSLENIVSSVSVGISLNPKDENAVFEVRVDPSRVTGEKSLDKHYWDSIVSEMLSSYEASRLSDSYTISVNVSPEEHVYSLRDALAENYKDVFERESKVSSPLQALAAVTGLASLSAGVFFGVPYSLDLIHYFSNAFSSHYARNFSEVLGVCTGAVGIPLVSLFAAGGLVKLLAFPFYAKEDSLKRKRLVLGKFLESVNSQCMYKSYLKNESLF